MNNNNKYILFYSNFCSNSKEFITQLYKTKYYELFMKVCVDKKDIKIPKQITAVPTIIVPNYPRPLTGGEAFFWLEGMGKIESTKEPSMQQKPGMPKKKVEGEFGNQTGSESIIPFSSEMVQEMVQEMEIREVVFQHQRKWVNLIKRVKIQR